jgi:HPt (histidine-containing phosphotransfer) domain-containing protein
MLAPDVVTSYLRTLAEKSEALKLSLATADDVAASADSLADSIHALAGSAGMFGFKRLVSLAKPFEHALRADPSRADNLRLGVCTVLAASIAEMHRHFETSPPETAAAIE